MVNKMLNEYVPDSVSPPGDSLLEAIETLNMSQKELAERTGRPLKTINEIIKGKTAITHETALQFEKVIGAPASFWMNRERIYREFQARQNEQENLKHHIDWLNKFPIKAMIKQRWISAKVDKLQLLNDVLSFFGVSSPDAWNRIWLKPNAAFRKSHAFESDPYSIAAWLRKGELMAQEMQCELYNKRRFKQLLNSKRELTTEPPYVFSKRLIEMGASAGVAIVFLPEIPGTRVSGVTRWLSQHKAIIQLSFRYKTNDQLWFSFFHEAGHILLHGKNEVFLETNNESSDIKEREANRFAEEILIPHALYSDFIKQNSFSEKSIIEFAKICNIAPGIIVGRLQHDNYLRYNQYKHLKVTYSWENKS